MNGLRALIALTAVVAAAVLIVPAGTADRVVERMFPQPNPYLADPDGHAQHRLGLESWSGARLIRQAVLENRHTAVKACHSSTKTHTAASIACWWLDVHPPGEAFVVSTAPGHYQVQSLLWAEIGGMHSAASLPGRLVGLTGTSIPEWYIGEERVGYGRKTADEPDPAKAMQKFQGKHARYMLVIIDEAGGVEKWLFDAIDSMASNANARVLVIGNPDDPTSEFAQFFKPGSKYHPITISAFDTPAFTDEPVSDDLLELMIHPEYVAELASLGEDSHLYQSKVLGEFPDVSDDALFPPRFLLRAAAQDLPGVDRGGYSLDVARFGTDKTVLYRNRGGVLRIVKEVAKKDTEETADMVEEALAPHGPDRYRIPITIDGVGVGGGVVDKLRRRGYHVIDFNGGTKPLRRGKHYRYANRRSEAFWDLREGMEDGLADIDPADKELSDQLGRIKFKILSGDVIHVETKAEMRKRGVKSPDRADAASMAYSAAAGNGFEGLNASTRPDESLTGDLLERAM